MILRHFQPTQELLTKTGHWSLTIRWLHFGLAFSVTLQLFLSLGMADSDEAEGLTQWWFIGHELFGLLALGFAGFHWGWLLSGHDGGFKRLFPWGSAGWRAVGEDLRGLVQLHLPQSGPRPGLPSLVEGLGLSVVTVQGLVGLTIFIVLPPIGGLPEQFEWLTEFHAALGSLVWVYWFGHAGMAILHRFTGDDALRGISPFSRHAASAPRLRARVPGWKGDRGGL